MELRCPKGHVSTDADYCSECGARMAGAASAIAVEAGAALPPAAATAGEPCPVCTTPRVPGARFCEVCRYDFAIAVRSDVSAAVPSMAPVDTPSLARAISPASPAASTSASTEAAAPPPAAPLVPGPQHWDVIISVDPSLDTNPDPARPCPVGAPDRLFPLDMDENLVGRRSDRKDIHPEIAVADPGISRRHLSFRRRDDGSFLVLELGSTNGTMLNGGALEPGIPTPLKNGDRLTLGCWTRMTIRAR